MEIVKKGVRGPEEPRPPSLTVEYTWLRRNQSEARPNRAKKTKGANNMAIHKISESCSDYHGCGKAWAAIVDGEVVALRYMGDHPLPGYGDYEVPNWVRAVLDNVNGLDERYLPVCRGSKALSKVAQAAEACDDCPKPPRRERYRPSELVRMAREVLIELDQSAFTAYRAKCRDELGKRGVVKSGMASCYEFIVKA